MPQSGTYTQHWPSPRTVRCGRRPCLPARCGPAATVRLNVGDERLAALTQPQQVASPNPLAGPLAASGPYWGTLLLFVWGFYLTTTPSYIESTGVNLWGLSS